MVYRIVASGVFPGKFVVYCNTKDYEYAMGVFDIRAGAEAFVTEVAR